MQAVGHSEIVWCHATLVLWKRRDVKMWRNKARISLFPQKSMKGSWRWSFMGFYQKRRKKHLQFHCKVVVSGLLELAVMEKLVWCGEVAVSVSATVSHKIVELCAQSSTLVGSVRRSVSARSSFTAWETPSTVLQVPWLVFVSACPLPQCQWEPI